METAPDLCAGAGGCRHSLHLHFQVCCRANMEHTGDIQGYIWAAHLCASAPESVGGDLVWVLLPHVPLPVTTRSDRAKVAWVSGHEQSEVEGGGIRALGAGPPNEPQRCRANMAHIRPSRPDSGLGFQAQVAETVHRNDLFPPQTFRGYAHSGTSLIRNRPPTMTTVGP